MYFTCGSRLCSCDVLAALGPGHPGPLELEALAYQVVFQAMEFVHRDGAVFLRDTNAYKNMTENSIGDRIEFPGSPNESFKSFELDREVVASFPGMHGYANVKNRWSNLLTLCLFARQNLFWAMASTPMAQLVTATTFMESKKNGDASGTSCGWPRPVQLQRPVASSSW